MSYPSDLLAQARDLANREPRRPRQTSLRRAVSTAYYALFHRLTAAAAASLVRGRDAHELRLAMRRAFTHAEMKKAARWFAGGSLPEAWASTLGKVVLSADLKLVAKALADLQEARQEADYDLGRQFTKGQVLDLLDLADTADRAWHRVRQAHEARVFLLALLLPGRVGRR